MAKRVSEEKLVAAFQVFDNDGSGELTLDEISAILSRPTSAGTQLEAEEARRLVENFMQVVDWEIDD